MKLIFWLTGNEYLGGCVSLTNGASFVHSTKKDVDETHLLGRL